MTYEPPPLKEPLRPFEEDLAVSQAAVRTGLVVTRARRLRIDPDVLDQRLWKRVPDKARIRKLLEDGVPVAGATLLSTYDYWLTPRETKDDGETA
jgi:hypothetical protein